MSDTCAKIPVGNYTGRKIDEHGVTFFKNIGAPDDVAQLWGGNIVNIVLTKTGPKAYNVRSIEPKTNRSHDYPLKLDVEDVATPPSGISTKTLAKWNPDTRTIHAECSNSKGVSWTIDWIFEEDRLLLKRTSDTATTIAEFQRQDA